MADPAVQSRLAAGDAVLSDIGTGLLEAPRAVFAGVRNAAQETGNALVDAGNTLGSGVDKAVSALGFEPAGRDITAPQLPAIDGPKSVTGGLVSSVAQFVTGMVGLGKITGPLKAAGGAKIIGETAKAATVGAVAFDPHGARLSDLIESIPGATNAVTQFLKSDPNDSAGLGRVKNALESIGMDAALVGGIAVSARLYKAIRSGDRAEIEAATAEANKLKLGADDGQANGTGKPSAVEGGEPPGGAPGLAGGDPLGGPKAAEASPAPARDVLNLGDPNAPKVRLAQSPTAAAAADGAPKPKPKLLNMEDDAFGKLVGGIQKDVEALTANSGSWDLAVASGHVFGRGERVPWGKLMETGAEAEQAPLLALMARTSDALQKKLNVGRGGSPETGVRSDAVSNRMLNARAQMFNEDPAALYGILEQAATAARTMQANMEAGFLVTQRAMQDSFALASRIRAGDLTAFGGDKDAALASLKQLVEIGATAYGHASSMSSNAGRSLRRMRSDFAFTPEQIAGIRSMDGEALAAALERTGGDPARIRMLVNPSLGSQVMDAAQWLLVNNLLWGPRTHFTNFATNTFMVAVRPAERMIGSFRVGGPEGSRIFEEGWRQYTYMGGSLMDSLRSAADAWKSGDSVIAPHAAESFAVGNRPLGGGIGQQAIQMGFKSWDSLPNVLHNALLLPVAKVAGAPTRALGTVDELVKQVVYRSKVQANAHVEALRSGLDEAADINAFVARRISAAFDDAGRATDLAALQEAKIATFQQELLQGTPSRAAANFAQEYPAIKFVLPFIKTPANVLRQGWKLTPGLNLASSEYRQMLRGNMGPDMASQAVGQMAVGSILMGTAGFLASSGLITGGGPDDKARLAELKATGWQPYSFVSRGEDGSVTFTPYGKFDPVAAPLGIIADLTEMMSLSLRTGHDVDDAVAEGSLAALLAIAKNLADKTFLPSIHQLMQAVMEPDQKFGRFAGQMAANFVPAGSGLRFANLDPHLRDARGFLDTLRSTVPGLSADLPPKRDMWGDPIDVHKGLWVDAKTGFVDAEMRRMITEDDEAASRPGPMLGGVDLREVRLVDGRDAYDVYQALARQPAPDAPIVKEVVGTLMQKEAYRNAATGSQKLRGTKLFMIYRVVSRFRDAAERQIRADANFREAELAPRLAVAAHYAAGGPPKTAGQKMMDQLGDIGAAFGVRLTPTE